MTQPQTTHRLMAVLASDVLVARELSKTVAGMPGDNMWVSSYSATGLAPPQYYISSGLVDSQFAALLGDAALTFGAYQQACAAQNKVPTITQAQVQLMYTNAIIRTDANGYEMQVLDLLKLKACPLQ